MAGKSGVIAYWIAFLVPAFAVLSPLRSSRGLRYLSWFLLAAGFSLFIGFRDEIGADWLNYLDQFYRFQTGEIRFAEPGYGLANQAAAWLGLGIYGANFFCAILFVAGLVYFCLHERLPWLAFTVSVPYIVIVVGMGYTKQAVALAILMWGFIQLQRGRTMRYVLAVLLAMTFHVSALIGFLFAALQMRRGGFRVALISLILITTFVAGFVVNQLEALSARFALLGTLVSGGAYFRISMNVIAFGLLMFFRKRFRERYGSIELWVWMGLLSVGCLLAVPYAAAAADRLALFFSPIQIVVFSRLPTLVSGSLAKTQAAVLVLGAYGSVLWIWMNLGTNAESWLPYQNVLLNWLIS